MEETSSPKSSPSKDTEESPAIPMDLSLIKAWSLKNLEEVLEFFIRHSLLSEYFPFVQFGICEPKLDDINYFKVQVPEGSKNEEYLLIHASLDVSARDGAIKMNCHGLPITFKTFRLKGKIRLALKPFTTKPFSFGGAQLLFLERPSISYKLNLAALPFKKGIDAKIMKFFDITMVFPKRVIYPMSPVDPMKYRSFMPIGQLAVRIKRLQVEGEETGLCPSCFGRGANGLYKARVAIGNLVHEFILPKDTDIPEEESWSEFLLEVFHEHRLQITLSPSKSNNLIGRLSLDVLKELGNGEETRYKRMEAHKKFEVNDLGDVGFLTLEMVWLPIKGSLGEESMYSGPTVALFYMYVYSCNNLIELETEDEHREPDTYLELSHGGEEESFSYIAQSRMIRQCRQPQFNYEHIIKCDKDWLTKNVSITVCRGPPNERFIYGGINLCIIELEKKPIFREIRTINSENPTSTITLSARIQRLLH